jgi:hypothetical protein
MENLNFDSKLSLIHPPNCNASNDALFTKIFYFFSTTDSEYEVIYAKYILGKHIKELLEGSFTLLIINESGFNLDLKYVKDINYSSAIFLSELIINSLRKEKQVYLDSSKTVFIFLYGYDEYTSLSDPKTLYVLLYYSLTLLRFKNFGLNVFF